MQELKRTRFWNILYQLLPVNYRENAVCPNLCAPYTKRGVLNLSLFLVH